MLTPKERMICAYRGLSQDRPPVAPEFWCYYPAKVLGVPMVEFEREIPFWKALKTTFERYDCEGFGISCPMAANPNIDYAVNMDGYVETVVYQYRGRSFSVKKRYDKKEPSWVIKRMVETPEELPFVVDMLLDEGNSLDASAAKREYDAVGERYLLEFCCGVPFFDFFADIMGFENAVLYFADEEEAVLQRYWRRYTEYQLELVRKAAKTTPYESYFIGCNYSCTSLIGTPMWRKWDKPYLKAMADEIHRQGKLLHIHFHGKSMETTADFAEIGIDCVCPFERGPGGNVNNLEDLQKVRQALDNKVTFNGNVHTVETLIRGNPAQVRREVREIKAAFAGSSRYIIGTGDQVGAETPEENILAMIEEAKRPSDEGEITCGSVS